MSAGSSHSAGHGDYARKSRGRQVPIATESGAQKDRTFVCEVDGCFKCFQRNEHLKRHIRSVHMDEKPNLCPHPGCDKSFSRRDNLLQHYKVHKSQEL
ncbi:hypothetical protein BOTBODRAFT_108145 [Botryobasidium botryosum FD-172 SS1]|uniref:C2H2-type domain-containing protein n=1 Tax=Botryobasidium botryosum (strain FD-172 SS1) TaxID=930990 RepID=A0A067MVH8_BOTB1|nr:hypothetical protein BOTBODRAFT_108145 [Botryobasidium botryosum FD-172 SS1]